MNPNTQDINKKDTVSSIPDHCEKNIEHSCVIYKFQSRPPYEGFVLILLIVIITTILIWWLHTKIPKT